MVAALAGLVKAKFPTLRPAEVAARIKAGADWLDTIAINRSTAGFLGKGRINFRKTLYGPLQAYSEVISITPSPLNAHMGIGTCPLAISIRNHIARANTFTIKFQIWDTATNRGVRLVGPDSIILAQIPPNYDFQIPESIGYRLEISQAQNQVVKLLAKVTVDGHTSYQVVALPTGYIGQDLVGPFGRLTTAGNARLGYWDNENAYGSSFTRFGRRLLGEGGIIIAKDSLDVRNNVFAAATKDNDFIPAYIKTVQADTLQIVEGISNSSASAPGRMGLSLGVKGYAWPSRSDRPGIITEYTVVNTGAQSLDSLRFGVYADWDINNYVYNQMRWDSLGGFGYCYSYQDSAFGALVPLSPNVRHGLFAIDAVPLTAGGNINLFDGFSDTEKWRTLFRERRSAGGQAGTNNVGIHHTKLPSLGVGQKQRVAYAWIAGATLAALREAANHSKDAYRLLRMGRPWSITNQFSNCLGDSIRIPLPPGRWQIADSSGAVIAQTRDSLWFYPTKQRTELRVQQLDSLFTGPETVIVINSRRIVDTLSIVSYCPTFNNWYDIVCPVRFNLSPALAGDSVTIRIRSLVLTTPYDTVGIIDSIRVPAIGAYEFCRTIRTPEGCVTTVCDTADFTLFESVADRSKNWFGPIPNPASNYISIMGSAEKQEIWDAKGALVWTRQTNKIETLSVATWPRGIYTWRCGRKTSRLVLE
jgi:hypothetical protein